MDEGAKLAAQVWRVAHRPVPVPNDGLCYQRSEVVVVLPADTLHCDGNVGGWDGVVSDTDLRADEIRLPLLLCGDCGRGRGRWFGR